MVAAEPKVSMQRNEEARWIANDHSEELTTQKVVSSKTTNEPHQVSALSLKSIKKKRELEASINPIHIHQEDLPKEHFTFEDLKKHWDFLSNQYYTTGRMLMS